MRWTTCAAAALLLAALAGPLAAEETTVTVRVLSRDAKFVGTSMGGARVTIRDAGTGELLVEGVTSGSTGDTGRLMSEARERGSGLATPGAAAFEATLDLDRPTLLEIAAYGPLAQLQSAVSASTTRWVVPGRGLDGGDGVVLELAGFVVDILAPAAHQVLQGPDQSQEVEVLVNLTML